MVIDTPVAAIQFLLAAVFAEALHHKLNAPARFTATFAAYRLVPESLASPVARMVMALEAITVWACLFLQPVGLWTALSLLVAYAAGMTVNRARGRSFIDCGCGDEPIPISAALIVRNLLLAALALLAWNADAGSPLDWGGLFTQLAAAAAAFGLYRIINLLIANAAKFRFAGYTT